MSVKHAFNTFAAAVSWLTTGTPEFGLSAAEGTTLVAKTQGESFLGAAFSTASAAVSQVVTGAPDHGLLAAEGVKLKVNSMRYGQ